VAKHKAHDAGVKAIGRSQPKAATAPARAQSYAPVQRGHNRKARLREHEFDSTAIERAVFDPASETITIWMVKGGNWSFDCTKEEWREFRDDASAGGYFNETFKGT